MSKEEKRLMLFDMQEHPERYTDEQAERLLADEDVRELFQGMAMARMAGKRATPRQVDVDKAWKEFAKTHNTAKPVGVGRAASPYRHRMKIAASIAGAIILSGMALAAVQSGWFGSSSSSPEDPESAAQVAATKYTAKDSLRAATQERRDTLDKKPVVFDNAELGTILAQMADFYHVRVEYVNVQAQHVRLFFHWNKAKALEHNLEILNAFDRIQIEYAEGILKVK